MFRDSLGLTTKHVYFADSRKKFRVRYEDGFGIMRDAQTAKLQTFWTGDGWFAYNLAANLAQVQARAQAHKHRPGLPARGVGGSRHQIARDAQRVWQEMHKQLLAFMRHYQNIGKELDSAVRAYNQSIGSFDRSVVPQWRRFAGLVKGSEDEIPEPPAIEQAPTVSRYADEPEIRGTADNRGNQGGPKCQPTGNSHGSEE